MSIPEIWTLRTDANPEDEKSLADWGFSEAEFSAWSQAADVLRLTFPVDDAGAMADLWDYKEPVTLLRDGAIWFRGYVAETPMNSSSAIDSHTYVLKNVWWRLENTDYLQVWETRDGGMVTGKVYLGLDVDEISWPSTSEMMEDLAVYARSVGLQVNFDFSKLPPMQIPSIQAYNVPITELVKQILRWQPGVSIRARYDADGTTLECVGREEADAVTINREGAPISGLSVVSRPDLVVESFHVLYQLTAPFSSLELGQDGNAASYQRVVYPDVYPTGAEITPDSKVITVPVDWEPSPDNPGVPQPVLSGGQEQPIDTEILPPTGSSGKKTEQFWLRHAKLEDLGITTNDVILPTQSAGGFKSHTVELAQPLSNRAPVPLNPNSTPLYRPPSAADLPRYLVGGVIHDWMGVYAEQVNCSATLAIKATAVQNLAKENKAILEGMGGRIGKVKGINALLLDLSVGLMGTDAQSRVYSKLGTYEMKRPPGSGTGGTKETLEDALYKVLVPDLARRLWSDRSRLQWEGSLLLSEAESGAVRYLGKSLNIEHPNRPAWGSMKAQLQSESINLKTGAGRLRFGPPEHLAPQDWIELAEAMRNHIEAVQKFKDGADRKEAETPPPSGGGGGGGSGTPDPDASTTTGGRITPISDFSFRTIKPALAPWDLKLDGSGLKMNLGRIVGYEGKMDALLSDPTNTTFNPNAGDIICILIEAEQPTTYKLQTSGSWPLRDGYRVETRGSGNSTKFSKSAKALWQFHGDDSDTETRVQFGDNLWGTKLVADSHLAIEYKMFQEGSGDDATWICAPYPVEASGGIR